MKLRKPGVRAWICGMGPLMLDSCSVLVVHPTGPGWPFLDFARCIGEVSRPQRVACSARD